MALLATIVDRFCEHCSALSIWVLTGVGLLSFVALSVVLNVLRQLLFRNPKEPPVVFHWFPIIGSTISYGMDPYKFFFDCRKKVRPQLKGLRSSHLLTGIVHSMATFSRSSFSARRPLSTWAPKAMTSS